MGTVARRSPVSHTPKTVVPQLPYPHFPFLTVLAWLAFSHCGGGGGGWGVGGVSATTQSVGGGWVGWLALTTSHGDEVAGWRSRRQHEQKTLFNEIYCVVIHLSDTITSSHYTHACVTYTLLSCSEILPDRWCFYIFHTTPARSSLFCFLTEWQRDKQISTVTHIKLVHWDLRWW